MTIPVSHGKPDAGNLHVRFEEGAGVPCGGAPLYSTKLEYADIRMPMSKTPSDYRSAQNCATDMANRCF